MVKAARWPQAFFRVTGDSFRLKDAGPVDTPVHLRGRPEAGRLGDQHRTHGTIKRVMLGVPMARHELPRNVTASALDRPVVKRPRRW